MKHKPLPFWSNELTEITKKRNIARNKFNRHKTLSNNLDYKRLKAQTQRRIKESAKSYWQDYCNTLNKNTKLASVWRMSKKMNGTKTNFKMSDLTKDGVSYTSNKDKADLLAKQFADVSSNKNYPDKFLSFKNNFETSNVADYTDTSTPEQRDSELNEDIGMSELVTVLKQCKKKSAPGADGILYSMIKNLPDSCLAIILNLFH